MPGAVDLSLPWVLWSYHSQLKSLFLFKDTAAQFIGVKT